MPNNINRMRFLEDYLSVSSGTGVYMQQGQTELYDKKQKYLDSFRDKNLDFILNETKSIDSNMSVYNVPDNMIGSYYRNVDGKYIKFFTDKDFFEESVSFEDAKKKIYHSFIVYRFNFTEEENSKSIYNYNVHHDTTIKCFFKNLENCNHCDGNWYDTSFMESSFVLNVLYNLDIPRSHMANFSGKIKINEFLYGLAQIIESINLTIFEYQNRSEILSRRPNTVTTTFQDNIHGEYVKHTIPFAVELEMYGSKKETVAKMSRDLNRSWGVCRDGSLESNIGFPIEIQSPILKGNKGEKEVIKTCGILSGGNFAVDKTCGMHLHFGCGDAFVGSEKIQQNKEKPVNLISLYLFHRLFEPVIVSFLPTTRRKNRYCATFKDGVEYHGSRLDHSDVSHVFAYTDTMKTLLDFEKFWYRASDSNRIARIKNERYTISRYMGVNFHSLLKDNHVEIRYHSGTLNYEKILYWVNLHGKIIELCASGVINKKRLTEVFKKNLSLDDLTKEMFDMLSLDNETVEYLMERKHLFQNADNENVEEIIINKTKKLSVV